MSYFIKALYSLFFNYKNRFVYNLLKAVSHNYKVCKEQTKIKIYSSEKTTSDSTFCTLMGPDLTVRVFKPLVLLLKRFFILLPHAWENKVVSFYDLFKTLLRKRIILFVFLFVILLLRVRYGFYSEDLIKKRLCKKKKLFKLRKTQKKNFNNDCLVCTSLQELNKKNF